MIELLVACLVAFLIGFCVTTAPTLWMVYREVRDHGIRNDR